MLNSVPSLRKSPEKRAESRGHTFRFVREPVLLIFQSINQSINQLTSQFQKPVLDPGEAEADVQDPGEADEAKKPWPVVREEGLQTYRGMGTVFSCTSAS